MKALSKLISAGCNANGGCCPIPGPAPCHFLWVGAPCRSPAKLLLNGSPAAGNPHPSPRRSQPTSCGPHLGWATKATTSGLAGGFCFDLPTGCLCQNLFLLFLNSTLIINLVATEDLRLVRCSEVSFLSPCSFEGDMRTSSLSSWSIAFNCTQP